ncbi:MAG TPA: porin [Usitatibacteraceae bacterium]|nr:porin [Usitatibacteraceae bacterium]
MNKKLMALAVAGACVAPTAMAQTANPVTLYGRVYVNIQSVEAKGGPAASNASNRMQVSDDSSLLGVRGTEDIGGGNKVFFQLETAFKPDSNAAVSNTFAQRNSAVGLQGGWGSLLAGRWDSPYKVLTYGADIFGDLNLGGITAALHDRGNFDVRQQNVIQYWTPNFAGFTVKLAGTANEGKTASLNPRQFAGNLVWSRGPIALSYAYEEHKDVSATIRKETGNEGVVEFKFGAFKVSGIYEEIKKDGTTKQKNYLASLLWTAGKHQVGYQFSNSKDGGANGAETQPDCDVNAVGYFYNWSKRSQFVATYVKVDNNAASVCKFGSNDVGGAGADREGFGVGIKHVF